MFYHADLNIDLLMFKSLIEFEIDCVAVFSNINHRLIPYYLSATSRFTTKEECFSLQ